MVFTDFSIVRLAGICCFRKSSKNELLLFHFVSLSTTKAESRLPVIEDEVLAIKFMLQRIGRELILYRNLRVCIDQEPLVTLLNNNDLTDAALSPMLKMKILNIQAYGFRFKYVESSKNRADSLSRLALMY